MIFRLLALPMRLVRWLYVQLGRVIETEEVSTLRRAVAEARRREIASQAAAEQLKNAIRFTKARRLWGLDIPLATAGVENHFGDLCPICLQPVSQAHKEWLSGIREADAGALISVVEGRIAERQAAEAALAKALEDQAGAPTIQEMIAESRERDALLAMPGMPDLAAGVAEAQAELNRLTATARAVAEANTFAGQAAAAPAGTM